MTENLKDELYQLENKQVTFEKKVKKTCYITKISKFFIEKKMSILTGLKVQSLACKCVSPWDQLILGVMSGKKVDYIFFGFNSIYIIQNHIL